MLERADWTTQPFHVYDLADMYDAYRLLDLGNANGKRVLRV